MLNKGKHKKGSSLIEIIISMALLSILMIPLSSSMIQLAKTNKSGEVKQIASYEGQKILEEFKGYSKITFTDGKFTLLNGSELEKVSADKYKSNFNVTNGNSVYEVDLSLVKNEKFDNTKDESEETFVINFNENNKVAINNKNSINFRSNYMKIKISNISNKSSSYKIEFYYTDNENQTMPDYSITDEGLENKKVVINVGEEYTKELKIEIENNDSKNELNFESNIYKSEDEENRGIIDVSSIKGNNILRINRNLEVGANGTLEQLYIINVKVKKQGEEKALFESSNTQNIIINENI